jgi:DNA-binding XRE family transcriptional regulator
MPAETENLLHPVIKQYKVLKKRRGMNQQDVADLVGISKQQIAFYESGHSIPNLVMMTKMIQAVGGEGITTYGWE